MPATVMMPRLISLSSSTFGRSLIVTAVSVVVLLAVGMPPSIVFVGTPLVVGLGLLSLSDHPRLSAPFLAVSALLVLLFGTGTPTHDWVEPGNRYHYHALVVWLVIGVSLLRRAEPFFKKIIEPFTVEEPAVFLDLYLAVFIAVAGVFAVVLVAVALVVFAGVIVYVVREASFGLAYYWGREWRQVAYAILILITAVSWWFKRSSPPDQTAVDKQSSRTSMS